MWLDAFCCAFIVVLLGQLVATGTEKRTLECDSRDLDNLCEANERCVVTNNSTKGVCDCLHGHVYVSGKCVATSTAAPLIDVTTVKPGAEPNSTGGSVAASLVLPTLLIIAGVAVYFGARRYKWVQRFRQFRQNRYGNVLVTSRGDYDGDDDILP